MLPSPVVEPEKELERCILGWKPSTMELPRWLASHSSVNLPDRVETGASAGGAAASCGGLSSSAYGEVSCEFATVLEAVWSW